MKSTYAVAAEWFRCLQDRDYEAYYALIDDAIEWVNLEKVPGVSDCLPWLGTIHGKSLVLDSYLVFGKLAKNVAFTLHDIHVDGETAIAHLHEEMQVLKNGECYAIDGTFVLVVKGGKVVRWQGFWDPSDAIRAFQTGRGEMP